LLLLLLLLLLVVVVVVVVVAHLHFRVLVFEQVSCLGVLPGDDLV
jgi:hypothetical protein